MVFTYLKEKVGEYHEHHPCMVGRFYALSAGLANASVVVILKFIQPGLHFSAIISIQSISALCFMFMLYMRPGSGVYSKIPRINTLLLLRGLSGFVLMSLFNLGIQLLPASSFIVIHNTQSIWTVLLAPFLLKEYPNKQLVALVLISFVGLILLVKPTILLPTSLYEDLHAAPDFPVYYYIVPLTTGLGVALTGMFLKAFSKEISSYQNAYHFLCVGSMSNGLVRIYKVSSETVHLSMYDVIVIALSGAGTIGFQVAISLAFKYEKRVAITNTLLNSQVVFAYMMQFFLLSTPLDVINCVGGAILIICAVLITLTKEALEIAKNNDAVELKVSSPVEPKEESPKVQGPNNQR